MCDDFEDPHGPPEFLFDGILQGVFMAWHLAQLKTSQRHGQWLAEVTQFALALFHVDIAAAGRHVGSWSAFRVDGYPGAGVPWSNLPTTGYPEKGVR